MSEPLNILIIEDRNADFMMVERHLKKNGLAVRCSRVDTLDGLKEAINRENWDLVLSDYSIPQLNFQDILKLMLTALPDLPVIMVTGTVGEEKAVELLKLGISDFVLKERLVRLVPAIERCLNDVAERLAKRSAEKALRESEERLELALRGANDGLWDWNLESNEIYYSPRWKSMLGYADEELENRYDNWERLLHPEDIEPTLTRLHDFLEGRTPRYDVEYRMRHKDGHYVYILSRAFPIYDDHGEALRVVGTHVDITDRKLFEEKLRRNSEIDHLTKIFNRRKLFEIMEFEIGKSRRYSRALSLILVDLDHFKKINDTHGHNIGDRILKATARIVSGLLRNVDVFARYGGDEFIVLCPETGIDGAVVLAEKLRMAFEEISFPPVGKVTISVGVAALTDEKTVEAFIDKADRALYNAKKRGRNRVGNYARNMKLKHSAKGHQ